MFARSSRVAIRREFEEVALCHLDSLYGTALRLTRNTLVVCAACYLLIELGGVQSIVLAFPETLLGVIVLEVLIGKWRGLRLLEYVRFGDLARRQRTVP